MPKSLVVRYTYTVDEFTTALNHDLRRYLGLLPVYAVMILAAVSLLALSHWVPAAVLFGFALLIVALPAWMRRETIRRFEAGPANGSLVEWRIGPKGISIDIPGVAHSDLTWREIKRIVETKDGFLVVPGRARFLWLPFHGFQRKSPGALLKLARQQGVNIRGRSA